MRRVLIQVAPANGIEPQLGGTTGPERRAQRLAPYWRERGVRVGYVYPRLGPIARELQRVGHEVHDIVIRASDFPRVFFRLFQLLFDRQYEAVYSSGPITSDFICGVVAAIVGVPHVVARPSMLCHMAISRWKRWFYLACDTLTFHMADTVLVVSEDGARRLKEQSVDAARKCVLVRNGVSCICSDLLTPVHPPIIGMIGHLRLEKGYSDVIATLLRLRQEGIPAIAEFLGAGPDEVELRRQVHEAGLCDAVKFLGYREDTAEIMKRWTVLLFPSRREGLPVALLEATATGVPIVAAHVGGVHEIIRHGETGYLVDVGDVDAMVRYCRELVMNPDARSTLVRRARAHVREHFSEARAKARVVDVIIAAISRAAGGERFVV